MEYRIVVDEFSGKHVIVCVMIVQEFQKIIMFFRKLRKILYAMVSLS